MCVRLLQRTYIFTKSLLIILEGYIDFDLRLPDLLEFVINLL